MAEGRCSNKWPGKINTYYFTIIYFKNNIFIQSSLFVALRGSSALFGNKIQIVKSHLNNHAITSEWTRVRIPLSGNLIIILGIKLYILFSFNTFIIDFNVTSSIAFRYLQFTQVYPNNARPIYYFDQVRYLFCIFKIEY